MAMGLATMNAIPGAARNSVVMVQSKPDKDLVDDREAWKKSYGITNSFDAKDYIKLDEDGYPEIRSLREIDDTMVNVYIVNNHMANDILNSLVEQATGAKPKIQYDSLYEAITGNTLLSEDQAEYEPMLEKVYLDKISKHIQGIEAEAEIQNSRCLTHSPGSTEGHYPLEERPDGAMSVEGDGSVKWPMLASVNIEDADRFLESLLTGKGETIV